jgi:transposase InsO family protein
MLPRQDYGIDFYGVYNGEVMVIVDLFTRETMLIHLNRRTQDNVAQTILNTIIFQRGVPRTLRTDNAPELSSLTGAVSAICEYLKISQIRTGGHNPRGNSICERVNQSIGSMILKDVHTVLVARNLEFTKMGKLRFRSLRALAPVHDQIFRFAK